MLWFRYIGISFLNWVVGYVLIAVLTVYLLPHSWTGYSLAIVGWLVSFIVTFIFAEWALHTQIPGKQETAMLLILWMLVTLTMYIFYFWYFLGTILPLINSSDTYVQLLLQMAAILAAAYLTRRRKIAATFGEGLEE